MLEKILNYGMYVVFIYIVKEYLDTFLLKKNKKMISYGIWVGYFVLQLLIPPLINNFIVSILFNICLLYCICEIGYKGSKRLKFMLTFSAVTIWIIIELLTGYILRFLSIKGGYIDDLGSVISKLILLVILKILREKIYISDWKEINIQYWLSLIIFPGSSIFVIYNLYILDYQNTGKICFLSAISTILILFLNIFFYKIYEKLSQDVELQKQNCVYEKQLEICMSQIREREQADLEIRELKHNIKGHFICIQEYVKTHDISALNRYLSEINNDLSSTEIISETGNVVFDAILNSTYKKCMKNSISFESQIQIPSNSTFNNADLSVILVNALDNAIDGTLKVTENERYIKIKVFFHHNNLWIEIVNSFDGVIRKDSEGKYKTRKSDNKNHGIGLKSIERASIKYQGLVNTEISSNVFKLTILLYDPIETSAAN